MQGNEKRGLARTLNQARRVVFWLSLDLKSKNDKVTSTTIFFRLKCEKLVGKVLKPLISEFRVHVNSFNSENVDLKFSALAAVAENVNNQEISIIWISIDLYFNLNLTIIRNSFIWNSNSACNVSTTRTKTGDERGDLALALILACLAARALTCRSNLSIVFYGTKYPHSLISLGSSYVSNVLNALSCPICVLFPAFTNMLRLNGLICEQSNPVYPGYLVNNSLLGISTIDSSDLKPNLFTNLFTNHLKHGASTMSTSSNCSQGWHKLKDPNQLPKSKLSSVTVDSRDQINVLNLLNLFNLTNPLNRLNPFNHAYLLNHVTILSSVSVDSRDQINELNLLNLFNLTNPLNLLNPFNHAYLLNHVTIFHLAFESNRNRELIINPGNRLGLLLCGDVELNPGPLSTAGARLNNQDNRDDRNGQDNQVNQLLDPDPAQRRMGALESGRPGSGAERFEKSDLQVISLNVRGLSDMKKVRHLVNNCYKLSNKSKNSIFFFQEIYTTKLELIRYLWRGESHLTPGLGNSLGCLTLVTAPYKIINSRNIGNRAHVLVLTKDDVNRAELIAVNVYAPNGVGNEKIQFFTDLIDTVADIKSDYNCDNVILGGDLNLIFSAEEAQHRSFSQAEQRTAEAVKNLFNQMNLIDGWEIATRCFTWTSNRTGVQSFSTLDRILFANNQLRLISKATDWSLSVSDHAAVIANFELLTNRPSIRMTCRLDPKILLDADGRRILDEAFRELVMQVAPSWNPHVRLEYFKMCIRTATNVALGKIKAQMRDLEATLNNDINDVVNELTEDCPDAERRALLMHKLDDLRQIKRGLVERIGAKLEQKTARKWYNEGELSNRYFFNLLNRKLNDEINVLLDSTDQEIRDPKLIEGEIRNFYKDLYESVPPELNIADDFFRHQAPITPEAAGTMTADLTLGDLSETLKTCGDSAPGPDGIPYSFLKHFWTDIGPEIMGAWRHSVVTGELPPSHKLSYLKLIPKAGKDPRKIANLRPITLSNTDHKLITKTYARKLTNLVKDSIGEEQTAYIPGRLINDNIRTLLTTIDLADLDNTIDGALISLDAKKAFDSVDHRYIRKTLEAFGLGNFVSIFNILYKDLRSDIIINGCTVQGYRILKGVKQGDALSCILFIMCVEPLLKNIKANPSIASVASGHLNIMIPKALGFADDVTVVCKRTIESIQSIFNEYETFTRASGLELNADKTEILCFNSARNTNHQFNVNYLNRAHTLTALDRVKINGIIFQQDVRQRETINVTKAINSMEKLLQAWSLRSLSLLGRILIIKTYAVSQVVFLMQSITLGEASHKAIERVIFKFLWNKNYNANRAPDRIKRSTMLTPVHLGGFGMINVRELSDSLDLRSYGRLINSKHPFFEQINDLIDSRDFFNVVTDAPVDYKLTHSLRLLNMRRLNMLNWPVNTILTNANYVRLLNGLKLKNVLTPTGKRGLPFFMIQARDPNICVVNLSLRELSSVERYVIYPQLVPIFKDLITTRRQVPGDVRLHELFPTKSKNLINISGLSSKQIRESRVDESEQIICIYKIGLILRPGEVISMTNQLRKLTSTRHKNILLRLIHGDIFSNERLHRFKLRISPSCSNCPEPNESIVHRVLECPNAVRAWDLMDDIKVRLGMNRLTDKTIESIVGVKEKLSKLELTFHAELVLKLTSNSEVYSPDRLVKSALKLISNCERLQQQTKEKLDEILNSRVN